ncbi:hypothetical protein BO85DRAFT_207841 [Aspergillus piperis CBS 112811]|uniref:Uncharacterized protein n=1 Tax=Aspergillus piperis CBS 112811 TaxID=1448313 RepID=A0A8G1VGH1_9EURO|nr:hypothetical protein BO85DRAFT_207841 [Aspergillus piperis CBS 112811]RAH52294.1 hypothetical protein BO85DRAFT_207841 [Aspergillus piperis CBS 112811]
MAHASEFLLRLVVLSQIVRHRIRVSKGFFHRDLLLQTTNPYRLLKSLSLFPHSYGHRLPLLVILVPVPVGWSRGFSAQKVQPSPFEAELQPDIIVNVAEHDSYVFHPFWTMGGKSAIFNSRYMIFNVEVGNVASSTVSLLKPMMILYDKTSYNATWL